MTSSRSVKLWDSTDSMQRPTTSRAFPYSEADRKRLVRRPSLREEATFIAPGEKTASGQSASYPTLGRTRDGFECGGRKEARYWV